MSTEDAQFDVEEMVSDERSLLLALLAERLGQRAREIDRNRGFFATLRQKSSSDGMREAVSELRMNISLLRNLGFVRPK